MAKIISMFSKQELTTPQFPKVTAIKIARRLIESRAPDFNEISMEERHLILLTLEFVANAAWVSPQDLYKEAEESIKTKKDKVS